jgi:peptide methionine sulfoxide reductase msrA/msrB
MNIIRILFLYTIIILTYSMSVYSQNEKTMKLNELNDFEKQVIIHKGTERPFTGIYNNHFEEGVYSCKQCDSPLFSSQDKFQSSCGWAAFDDENEGSIKYLPDADGRRTEIVCANCGGHLGHVFMNEGYTDKNKRHCVNSVSMKFNPFEIKDEDIQTAIFAAGCFWGVEYHLKNAPGVTSTEVGYTGGLTKNPTYEEVCSGGSGHAEAVKVSFDPKITDFEKLAILFFEIHDPGTLNRQGPDIGNQYRSEIFYMNLEQKETAEKLINILREKSFNVVTALSPAKDFFPAEDYHQDYYIKSGRLPYCHFYKKKF